jgi:hypothetical protein
MVGSAPSGINAERVHSAWPPGASNRNAPRALGADQKDLAKHVRAVADTILDVTEPNDIVLDPFAGSGITAVAAEKSNRRARLMEIDPHLCDVVVSAAYASGANPTSCGSALKSSSDTERTSDAHEPSLQGCLEGHPHYYRYASAVGGFFG